MRRKKIIGKRDRTVPIAAKIAKIPQNVSSIVTFFWEIFIGMEVDTVPLYAVDQL
jgi:hypothetical protein